MRNPVYLLSICLCLVLAGCSDRTTGPEPAPDTSAVIRPADLEKLADELIPAQARSISTGELSLQFPAELMTDGCEMYAVTIVWGQLLNIMPPVTDEIIDWSGRLAIDGQGAVSVRHQIDFEDGEDSVRALGLTI